MVTEHSLDQWKPTEIQSRDSSQPFAQILYTIEVGFLVILFEKFRSTMYKDLLVDSTFFKRQTQLLISLPNFIDHAIFTVQVIIPSSQTLNLSREDCVYCIASDMRIEVRFNREQVSRVKCNGEKLDHCSVIFLHPLLLFK